MKKMTHQKNVDSRLVKKNFAMLHLMSNYSIYLKKIETLLFQKVNQGLSICFLLLLLVSGINSSAIAQETIKNTKTSETEIVPSDKFKILEVVHGMNDIEDPRILAIDGTRDVTLNVGTGVNSNIQALAIQNDGKILLGGVFTSYNGTATNRIIRINADGSVDNSFVYGSGFDETDVYVSAILVQKDGKILIAGSFTRYNGTSANRIVRLNANGSVDASFNYGTGFDRVTSILKQQEDGKLIIGGLFTTYKGVTANHIIRLNLDGSLDNTFSTGSGFNSNILDIVIQPDGKFIVGGSFQSYAGTTSANRIIRLQANGSVDNSFTIGTGFDSSVTTIALQEDGRIIVGGVFANFTNRGANRIARLKANGEFDFPFGAGVNNTVQKAVIQDDGKIILIGRFTSFNGTPANRIVRINMSGSIDTSFDYGTGFNDTAELLEIQSDNKLVVTGRFSNYKGILANKIVRLLVGATPATAAPIPTHPQENVMSVFSDTYTNRGGTNLNPGWNQKNIVSFELIAGNNTIKYSNFDYQGIQLDETNHWDVSEMDYVHLDYWSDNTTDLRIFLISSGPVEVPYTLTVPTSGWNSVNIPLSEFDEVDLEDVIQFKFEGNVDEKGTIFLDNLYFFKEVETTSTPTVTFQADMRALLSTGIFDRTNETINVVGDFTGNVNSDWSTHYPLTEGNVIDSIWTVSVPIENPNSSFFYKYKILSNDVTRYHNSGWDAPAYWIGDNRVVDKPENDIVLDPIPPAIHLINGEPNNKIVNAFYIPLNDPKEFEITGLDDPDFYAITANAGDIVEIFTAPENDTDLDLDIHVLTTDTRFRLAYSDYNDGLGSEKVVFTVPELADNDGVGNKTIKFRIAPYQNQTYLAKTKASKTPRISAESGFYTVNVKSQAPKFDGPSEISAQVESDTVVTINWSEVTDATEYRLSVSRRINFFQFYGSGSVTDEVYEGRTATLNLPKDSVWYYFV